MADSVSAIVAVVLAAVRSMLPEIPPAAGGSMIVVGPLADTVPAELDTAGGAAVGVGAAIGTSPNGPTVPPPPPQLHNAITTVLRRAPRTYRGMHQTISSHFGFFDAGLKYRLVPFLW